MRGDTEDAGDSRAGTMGFTRGASDAFFAEDHGAVPAGCATAGFGNSASRGAEVVQAAGGDVGRGISGTFGVGVSARDAGGDGKGDHFTDHRTGPSDG